MQMNNWNDIPDKCHYSVPLAIDQFVHFCYEYLHKQFRYHVNAEIHHSFNSAVTVDKIQMIIFSPKQPSVHRWNEMIQ